MKRKFKSLPRQRGSRRRVLTRLSCGSNRPRLANNLLGNGLFEAGFGLNGEPARHLLGILKNIPHG
jgi:hypothetical protein